MSLSFEVKRLSGVGINPGRHLPHVPVVRRARVSKRRQGRNPHLILARRDLGAVGQLAQPEGLERRVAADVVDGEGEGVVGVLGGRVKDALVDAVGVVEARGGADELVEPRHRRVDPVALRVVDREYVPAQLACAVPQHGSQVREVLRRQRQVEAKGGLVLDQRAVGRRHDLREAVLRVPHVGDVALQVRRHAKVRRRQPVAVAACDQHLAAVDGQARGVLPLGRLEVELRLARLPGRQHELALRQADLGHDLDGHQLDKVLDAGRVAGLGRVGELALKPSRVLHRKRVLDALLAVVGDLHRVVAAKVVRVVEVELGKRHVRRVVEHRHRVDHAGAHLDRRSPEPKVLLRAVAKLHRLARVHYAGLELPRETLAVHAAAAVLGDVERRHARDVRRGLAGAADLAEAAAAVRRQDATPGRCDVGLERQVVRGAPRRKSRRLAAGRVVDADVVGVGVDGKVGRDVAARHDGLDDGLARRLGDHGLGALCPSLPGEAGDGAVFHVHEDVLGAALVEVALLDPVLAATEADQGDHVRQVEVFGQRLTRIVLDARVEGQRHDRDADDRGRKQGYVGPVGKDGPVGVSIQVEGRCPRTSPPHRGIYRGDRQSIRRGGTRAHGPRPQLARVACSNHHHDTLVHDPPGDFGPGGLGPAAVAADAGRDDVHAILVGPDERLDDGLLVGAAKAKDLVRVDGRVGRHALELVALTRDDAGDVGTVTLGVLRIVVGHLGVAGKGPVAVADEIVAALDLAALSETAAEVGVRVVDSRVHHAHLDALAEDALRLHLVDAGHVVDEVLWRRGVIREALALDHGRQLNAGGVPHFCDRGQRLQLVRVDAVGLHRDGAEDVRVKHLGDAAPGLVLNVPDQLILVGALADLDDELLGRNRPKSVV
ncbi:hypothetical protein PpBr36_04125 [Pyricularia pennisetigena]|uniref:hypothetical protein n=1 Tax=Pyricularia pennisetigena TaxID=1578925 RepID=UPI00114F3058|nr:hypothetical protein PpBr36_04125 [Pyricularia pennisetigena]TLS26176.1 hypothetical protein PpBr36_04125 [Pyricularia pennisetigena]